MEKEKATVEIQTVALWQNYGLLFPFEKHQNLGVLGVLFKDFFQSLFEFGL
jgi:hypothetical protein